MFEEFDFDTVMERMLSRVSDKFDKREGSIIYDAIAPAALELAEFYIALDIVAGEAFAESASYYYLIKRAAERGIYPEEETCAAGRMEVSPPDAPVSVGDRFNLNDLNYTVSSAINAERGEYRLECETAGTVGNQQLGELLPIQTKNSLDRMQSAVLTEILIPGEEEEDAEAFRERYFASLSSEAFGGNKADYREKIRDLDGVGGCRVARAWERGFRPADMVPGDEVSAWFGQQSEQTIGTNVYHWLETVYNAAQQKLLTAGGTVRIIVISSEFKQPSDTLVEMVQEAIDPAGMAGEGEGIAPIGHVVEVTGVKNAEVDIGLPDVTYAEGYSFEKLKGLVGEAVDSYFSQLRQGWEANGSTVIRISQIESRLLGIEGIEDISGTRLNGKEENLILEEEYIPVRGDVVG